MTTVGGGGLTIIDLDLRLISLSKDHTKEKHNVRLLFPINK